MTKSKKIFTERKEEQKLSYLNMYQGVKKESRNSGQQVFGKEIIKKENDKNTTKDLLL